MHRLFDKTNPAIFRATLVVLFFSAALSGCLGDPDSPGVYGSSLQQAAAAGLIAGDDLKRSVTTALWNQLGEEFVSKDVLMAGGRAYPFEALSIAVKVNVVSAMVRNVLNGDVIQLDMEAFFDPEKVVFTPGTIMNWKILEKGSALLTVEASSAEGAPDFDEAGPNEAFVRPFVPPGGGYLCMDARASRIALEVKEFGERKIVFEGKEIPLGSHYLTVSCKGLSPRSIGFSLSGDKDLIEISLPEK